MSILMDGFIYEAQIQQQRVIVAFLAQYVCRDEIDQALIHAMRKAQFGLYRIEAITTEYSEIQLKALVAEVDDATLTNFALAETAQPGMIIALRLLRLPDFTMGSGVFLPFVAVKEKRIVREWWKQQGLERYAHFFRLSRKEPIHADFV
jgi:hypothetical protein